ncbi:Protein CBR-SRI-27 [Caenorhabditis briggsae]|uniref:Protein CBR-SRI-27 n=1 Tax=Caenorhabditis briggsae TaxID=6238 RepID=A8XW21_CAEBR|nr:Protein CBR-SRI-27 [Caenorhabditis briggsae]CAP36840.2 Protein CBR-SRI-27 [Caenorhabditis briggsae]
MSGQIEVLTICFLRKHKAVMNIRNLSKATNWKYPIFYTGCILFTCSIAFSVFMSGLYPEVAPNFRALREFHYYILNNWLITFFVLTTIGTAKATVIVSILVLRMYKTLNDNASQISSKTLAKHKTALKSLIMQFMTTPISFFPAFVVLLTVLIPTEYSQKISWWSLMVGTTHSTLNSIVVIITYAELRKALFFWRRNAKNVQLKCFRVSILVSSVRPSGVQRRS